MELVLIVLPGGTLLSPNAGEVAILPKVEYPNPMEEKLPKICVKDIL